MSAEVIRCEKYDNVPENMTRKIVKTDERWEMEDESEMSGEINGQIDTDIQTDV